MEQPTANGHSHPRGNGQRATAHKRYKIEPAEWPTIVQLWKDGHSASKIARKYNVTPPTILSILARYGIRVGGHEAANRRIGRQKAFKALQLLRQGYLIREAAKQLGMSETNLRRLIYVHIRPIPELWAEFQQLRQQNMLTRRGRRKKQQSTKGGDV